MQLILLVIGAYLLGSIPTGLLVGKLHGVDLRQHGSNNIGATNAGRVLGRRIGLLVFALDACKGLGPAFLGQQGAASFGTTPALAGLAAGVAAIVGHMFPLYLRFRGGKGVATAAGVFLGLVPLPASIALLMWILVLLVSRMVALASMAAAWTLPIVMLLVDAEATRASRPVLLVAFLVSALITWRHQSNIGRILRGEEPRISLARK